MQLSTKTNIQKIPLLRYDKNKPHLYSGGGAHRFDTCGEYLPIALDVLNIHHFNFRRQENTLRRLKQLTMQNSAGINRAYLFDKAERRYKKSVDAKSVYYDRYKRAKLIYDENIYKIFFIDELKYLYNNITRWYNPYQLNAENDTLLNQGIHNYFLKNYDLALFKFNDILSTTYDYKMELLLSIKIAQCLSFTNKSEALSILRPILNCHEREISEYATKQYRKISENIISVEELSGLAEFIIQPYYGQHVNKNYI
jgi:hypothetical protein